MTPTPKTRLGVRDLVSRVPRLKFLALLIVTIMNSCVSLTFVAVTTLASGLTNQSTLREILFFCVKGVTLYIVIYFGMYLTEILINSIMKDLCLSLSDDCLRGYYGHRGGREDEILSAITQDVRMLREDYYLPILALPTYVFRALLPIIYLLSRNVLVGLLFTFGAAMMLLPQYVGKGKINRMGKAFSDAREESLGVLTDAVKGKTMILNNGAAGYFLHKTYRFFDRTEDAERRLKNVRSFVFCLSGPLKGMADVLPFAVGIYLMGFDGRISLVLLLAMLATAGQLKDQFQQIIYLAGDMSGTPEVRDKLGAMAAAAKMFPRETSCPPIRTDFDALVLRDLGKSYGERVLFEQVSVRILQGAKVLLVGESGIGKSTFFRLLMGQEEPTRGECFLEKGGARRSPAGQISLVQQEPFFFKGDIRENISLGEDFGEAEVRAVLERVHFRSRQGEDVLALPVEKGGANLSGGEKARLELARALLRKRALILADEITANLDSANADLIRGLLHESDATVIEIAHHYTDAGAYDVILELRDQRMTVKKAAEV